jgi:hypothetical protein
MKQHKVSYLDISCALTIILNEKPAPPRKAEPPKLSDFIGPGTGLDLLKEHDV